MKICISLSIQRKKINPLIELGAPPNISNDPGKKLNHQSKVLPSLFENPNRI